MNTEINTERLILRQWKDEDLEAFAAINADPVVMQYYPSTQTREDSFKMAKTFRDLISKKGWGFWAVEMRSNSHFIGFVGLHEPSYALPVTPCVEIGWRLKKEVWGKGYATEAAKAALDFAFNELKLAQVYSFTSTTNIRSRSVMERIGMKNTNQNFAHPFVPPDHSLSEHVLYKIENVSQVATRS